MAIPIALAEYILSEHLFRPLPEKILLLGRQTMLFDFNSMQRLLNHFGIPTLGLRKDIDNQTIHAKNNPSREFVTDSSFFAALGVRQLDALDYSDFEGANILLDICAHIPPKLQGQYDFIFNGSVLDNVFDPPAAIRNISRLLSSKGRVLHIETASTHRFSYTALSPSWFYDYYVTNSFADCKIYVGTGPSPQELLTKPWAVLAYKPTLAVRSNAFTPGMGDHAGITVCLAEKQPASTNDLMPTQGYYRNDDQWQRHLEKETTFFQSSRPYFLGKDGKGSPLASLENVYISCGYWGHGSKLLSFQ